VKSNVLTANIRRPIILLIPTQITSKIHKRNIADLHQARTRRTAIPTTRLSDRRAVIRTGDLEVGEQDIADGAPAAATRLIIRLVGGLVDEDAGPGFDVGGEFHVLVAADDLETRDQYAGPVLMGEIGDTLKLSIKIFSALESSRYCPKLPTAGPFPP